MFANLIGGGAIWWMFTR